jgi:FkbM family methyltransferase
MVAMNSVIRLPLGLVWLRKFPIRHKLGILERIFGKTLAKHGVCWVRVSNGNTWKLDLRDASHRWIVYGDYEGPIQMQWIRQWLHNGGVVVDSGTNIGQMLLFFAPLPRVCVHGFEPLPVAADWVDECLSNYPEWNVTIVRKGLSDVDKDIPIQVDGARSTARMDWYIGKSFPSISIEVLPLDKYLDDQEIGRVRLWKLDVEGYELQALRGARQHLEKNLIDAILVEISTSTHSQVIDCLEECGYHPFKIAPGNRLVPYVWEGAANENIVALPTIPSAVTENQKAFE